MNYKSYANNKSKYSNSHFIQVQCRRHTDARIIFHQKKREKKKSIKKARNTDILSE